jgi:hypothetical protein
MSKFILVLVVALTLCTVRAQSPKPILVQAVGQPNVVAAPARVKPVDPAPSAEATLKALEELKSANDVLLKQQNATLLQLEEMEKAADQIKIYSKRG